MFEANVTATPDKLFLGSRTKVAGENGTHTLGDYAWKTFGQVY